MKAAVIGQPVSHSLSPSIFKFLRNQENSPLEYEAREVSLAQVNSFLESMRTNAEWRGVNVTLPLKEAVIANLDAVSDEARSVGAVNVIQRKGTHLHGFNTDIIGIEKTFHFAGLSVRGKNCLVFGAGGSARALLHVLGNQGAKRVLIYNPRSSRGQDLVIKFSPLFPGTEFTNLALESPPLSEEISLLVNTTPVGMSIPDREYFKLVETIPLSNDALAFDFIYTPKFTLFLKAAAARGVRGVGGLGMLIDQALATWELWVGKLRNSDKTRSELLEYLQGHLKLREDSRPIFLTGFMGAGKSTIGHELAKSTGRRFFDTDRVVETAAKKSISEIFSEQGEASFRLLEKNAVSEICLNQGAVIALGGGVLNDPENLEKILAAGTLIYLSAQEATLAARLKTAAKVRPLLEGLSDMDRVAKISELLRKRLPIYAQAHFEVAIDGLDQTGVAEKILTGMGRKR